MKVLDEGHAYALDSHEPAAEGFYQQIQFIKKVKEGEHFVTVYNGTTNEDVLRVLIDRLQSMQAKVPCRENAIVITKLEESLMWLEKRTKDRVSRNVEGTPKN